MKATSSATSWTTAPILLSFKINTMTGQITVNSKPLDHEAGSVGVTAADGMYQLTVTAHDPVQCNVCNR